MKILAACTLNILLITSSFAQSANTITGHLANSNNHKPIDAATISLLKTKDSSLVKIAVSDKAGSFVLEGIAAGSYLIRTTALGFTQAYSPSFQVTAPALTIDSLFLQPEIKALGGVTVSTKKPFVEQKLDRMVVNVDASVTSIGSTALEVLEKSPGVTVDKDGNISLKGKPKVMVMIDGKPSYLSSADLANVLTNMNASQLSQIEIMTNPSAKYDAAGNAGVINIKTKAGATKGFNGSITLSYGQGVYAKSNSSIMLNYRTAKLNTFLNYSLTTNNSFMDLDIKRSFYDNTGVKTSELDQLSHRTSQSQNNNLKLGLDYFINTSTTIGISANGFITPRTQDALSNSTVTGATGNATSFEQTSITGKNTWKNGSINAHLHTSFDNNTKELTANADYLHYDFSANQNIVGTSYDASKTLLGNAYLNNVLPLNIDIYSARFDYSQTLANGTKLEAGIKLSDVKTNNTSSFYRLGNSRWVVDSNLSNSFRYDENINAAYINLNKKINKWNIQAGVRLENTNYSGLQSAYNQAKDSSFSRSYLGLFPNLFIGYELNENNQFVFSAGRRIDRPVYTQLNPFISFVDKYTYSTGNAFLQPQYSNNLELSHTYKNMFTTTLNFSVINQMINETLTHIDTVIVRSIGNIGKRYNYGIAESASIPVTPWFSTTLFANLFVNTYNGTISGLPFTASQLTFEANVTNQFTFKNGWAAELSGNYTTKSRDEGQALVLAAGQVSAGLSKQILNNKGSIKLNVRDIFFTQNPREIQNFQDIQSTLRFTRDTRVVNIAFVYRFGIQPKQKAGSTPTDEQKRIQLN